MTGRPGRVGRARINPGKERENLSVEQRSSTDKASIDGEEEGKTPAAQRCGLENRSAKVLEQASCG